MDGSGDLAEMLRVITEKLENLERKSAESEVEKATSNTRMDVMADMLFARSC